MASSVSLEIRAVIISPFSINANPSLQTQNRNSFNPNFRALRRLHQTLTHPASALRSEAMRQLSTHMRQSDFSYSPSLKRKNKEQSPSPPPSPKRYERAPSFISISSDEDEPDNPEAMQPRLCREQQDLVDLIMSGQNVFFTGSAGCGKSTVLKAAIDELKALGKRVVVTAPTGKAALNVDGMTLYSYMGWSPEFRKYDLKKLLDILHSKSKKETRKRLTNTDVLVIDEISMVENNFLTRMEEVLHDVRQYRYGDLPWGGLQLIFTGDFCQLPPVVPFEYCWECGKKLTRDFTKEIATCPNRHGSWNIDEEKWAFKSPAWEYANFAYVNLNEIHRQSDRPFIKTLQKCRLGIPFSEEDFDLLFNHESEVDNATQLVCKIEQAEEINKRKLAEITEYPLKDYRCEDGIWFPPWYKKPKETFSSRDHDGALTCFKDHRFNPIVQLKETQVVMLQVNLNIKKGLVNGSQGVIIGWERIDINRLPSPEGSDADLRKEHVLLFTEEHMRKHPEPENQVWPVVRFTNGYKKTIYPVCVVSNLGDNTGIKAYRTQLPLIPGWAITIHKSQGMTLDRVIVDLSNAFEVGQVYVALSRATSLRGLHIKGGSRGDLSIGKGGIPVVHQFLREKFGRLLYDDHEGSRMGSP